MEHVEPRPRLISRKTVISFFLGFGGCLIIELILLAWLAIAVVLPLYHEGEEKAKDPAFRAEMQNTLALGFKAPPLERRADPPPADFSLQMIDLQGKTVSLSDFRGKTIVLNFFATWCPPCMAEMPSLIALSSQLADHDEFAVLCVSREGKETLSAFKGFPEGAAPLVYALEGKNAKVFQSSAIPATFIISPSGEVVFRHIGGSKWNAPEVVSFLQQISAGRVDQ